MNVILLGPPGCGKGTQGALLSEKSRRPRVSTGDLLRAAVQQGTALGKKAKGFMDQGLLVPDDIILGLIEEVLAAPASKDGVIMDGFPRTVPQAEAVGKLLARRKAKVDHVLNFDVPDAELVTRMNGRAKAEGRADDTPEAFQQRLKVYRKDTAPLIEYYKKQGVLTAIPATGAIEAIAERVTKALV